MQAEIGEIRRRFAAMPDEALRAIDRQELTQAARECLDEEFGRRAIEPLAPPAPEPVAEPEPEPAPTRWIPIAFFLYPDEALLVTQLLRIDNIPVYLANYYTLTANWNWANAFGWFQVRVPEDFAQQSREVLDAPVDEQEFAAEVEAAARAAEEAR